jgi:ABC-type taurine transport system ATPase subunit
MLFPAGREVLVQKPSAWASQKAKKPVHATNVSERESLVYRNARYQPGTGKPIVYNRTSAVPGLQVSDNGVYQDLGGMQPERQAALILQYRQRLCVMAEDRHELWNVSGLFSRIRCPFRRL